MLTAAAAAAAYCRCRLLDEDKIFWVGGGLVRSRLTHFPAAHVMLEVNRHTFGWG
jgi:hypothetical protein